MALGIMGRPYAADSNVQSQASRTECRFVVERVALGEFCNGNVAQREACAGNVGTKRGLCWKIWH